MAEKVIPAEIIKELKEVVKEYPYEATSEDAAALGGCYLAVPFLQLAYGGIGAGAAWSLSSGKQLARFRAMRLATAVGTGLWAGELSREHSHMACLKMLVALPTPLGGEVASLIRERDPNHAILKNAPKRMDGDPSARIATEEAKQSAAQRDTSIDINAPSSSRDSPAEGDAPGSAPAGVIPMWEFEPVMDPAPTDAASGEQPHTSRRRRRRSHGRSGQESGPQGEEALKDYFDSRWDEPRAPVQ